MLDFSALQPGQAASDAIRKAASDLKLGTELSGAHPPDRAGGDGGRGVRHLAGRRGGQRRRHDHHRAGHPLARPAFAEDHPGRLPQSRGRLCGDRRARTDDGRRAEPDLDCLRGAVCRPRRRFRHSVRGPLPLRAVQAWRSLFGAGQHGREGRRAADAGGGRGRCGLPVVFPDRLQGRLGARPDRRHRHADRLYHQHHRAAGAAHHPASAGRRGADRLSRAGAGRPVPGAPPHSGDRRHHAGRGRRNAAALLPDLRFQSDQSAKPDGGVGRDLPRSADRSDARRQRDQRGAAELERRRQGCRSAPQDSRGRQGHDDCGLRPGRAGAQARVDPRACPAVADAVEHRRGRASADRCAERRRAEEHRRRAHEADRQGERSGRGRGQSSGREPDQARRCRQGQARRRGSGLHRAAADRADGIAELSAGRPGDAAKPAAVR